MVATNKSKKKPKKTPETMIDLTTIGSHIPQDMIASVLRHINTPGPWSYVNPTNLGDNLTSQLNRPMIPSSCQNYLPNYEEGFRPQYHSLNCNTASPMTPAIRFDPNRHITETQGTMFGRNLFRSENNAPHNEYQQQQYGSMTSAPSIMQPSIAYHQNHNFHSPVANHWQCQPHDGVVVPASRNLCEYSTSGINNAVASMPQTTQQQNLSLSSTTNLQQRQYNNSNDFRSPASSNNVQFQPPGGFPFPASGNLYEQSTSGSHPPVAALPQMTLPQHLSSSSTTNSQQWRYNNNIDFRSPTSVNCVQFPPPGGFRFPASGSRNTCNVPVQSNYATTSTTQIHAQTARAKISSSAKPPHTYPMADTFRPVDAAGRTGQFNARSKINSIQSANTTPIVSNGGPRPKITPPKKIQTVTFHLLPDRLMEPQPMTVQLRYTAAGYGRRTTEINQLDTSDEVHQAIIKLYPMLHGQQYSTMKESFTGKKRYLEFTEGAPSGRFLFKHFKKTTAFIQPSMPLINMAHFRVEASATCEVPTDLSTSSSQVASRNGGPAASSKIIELAAAVTNRQPAPTVGLPQGVMNNLHPHFPGFYYSGSNPSEIIADLPQATSTSKASLGTDNNSTGNPTSGNATAKNDSLRCPEYAPTPSPVFSDIEERARSESPSFSFSDDEADVTLSSEEYAREIRTPQQFFNQQWLLETSSRPLMVHRQQFKNTFLDPYICIAATGGKPFRKLDVSFMGRNGIEEPAQDAGGPRGEYLAMLRHELTYGKWEGFYLFDYGNNHRMLSSEPLLGDTTTFVAVGLAVCDLVFCTGAAIEGIARCVIEAIKAMANGNHPVMTYTTAEVDLDHELQEAYISLSVIGGGTNLCEEQITTLRDYCFAAGVSLPEHIPPRLALKKREKLVQQFLVHKRLNQLWDFYEGLKAGGLIVYLERYPEMWSKVFPLVGELQVTAEDIMNNIVFEDTNGHEIEDLDGRQMTNMETVVRQYVTEIAGENDSHTIKEGMDKLFATYRQLPTFKSGFRGKASFFLFYIPSFCDAPVSVASIHSLPKGYGRKTIVLPTNGTCKNVTAAIIAVFPTLPAEFYLFVPAFLNGIHLLQIIGNGNPCVSEIQNVYAGMLYAKPK